MAIPYNIMDESAEGGLQNNIFNLTYASSLYAIVIPPGSYDGPNLAIILEALFNDATSSANFTVDYNIVTCHFMITSASGDFGLEFNSNSPTLELGFGPNVYGPTGTLESPYQVDLSGTPYFLLSIPEITAAVTNYTKGGGFTFVIPTTQPGTVNQSWSYLTTGPMHTQDFHGIGQSFNQFTVTIWFMRNGQLWPLIGDANTHYTLALMFQRC